MTEKTEETKEETRDLGLIAKKAFGDKYVGEEVVEEEVVEEETETEESEQEAAETEEHEETEEETEEEPLSFDEWAEAQGLDPEKADSTKIRVKVDGVSQIVTMKDLRDNYQINSAADKRLEEAKAKQKAFQEESENSRKLLNEQMGIAARMIEKAEKALSKDESAVDWNKLRQDDPAEYAAKKEEFKERREELKAAREEARNEFLDAQKKLDQQNQQKLNEVIGVEQKMLLEKIPEWQDQKVAVKEGEDLVNYLLAEGITGEEVKNMFDHRAFVIARKAMLWDNMKKNSDAAKKKVNKAPKTIKPGAAKPPGERESKQVQALKAKYKKSGKLEDLMAYRRAAKKAS